MSTRPMIRGAVNRAVHRLPRQMIVPEQNPNDSRAVGSSASERLLLKEFAHRINNELCAAMSIVAVEIARAASEEVRMPLTRLKRCLQGVAQVHHVLRAPELRTSVDACAYLRTLCQAIGQAQVEPRGIALLFVERPLRLDSERCWRLGLIVSELITNAVRHAFEGPAGQISVEVHHVDSAICCRVSDNGAGGRAVGCGTGLQIINALLADLGGRLEQDRTCRGSIFTVRIPTPESLWPAARGYQP